MNTQEVSLQTQPGQDFFDVAALNAHISTALRVRIETVREGARRDLPVGTRATCVLGPAGGGKTHLFARLRHTSGPGASVVLLRPFFGVGLSLRDVLGATIDQLCAPVGSGALRHIDLLVAHAFGDEGPARPATTIEEMRWNDATIVEERMGQAIDQLIARAPELAPASELVRRLLQVPWLSSAEAGRTLAWLSGREYATSDVQRALTDGDVLAMLKVVCLLASSVAPIVWVFDQLENLSGGGDSAVLSYGTLIAELVDAVPYGTIVQLALTSEWLQFIEPRLSLPQKTRVSHEKLFIEAPDRVTRGLLLRSWHERIAPTNAGRKRRFPRPLGDADLEALLSAPTLTPRLLLLGFQQGLAGLPVLSAEPPLPVESERASIERRPAAGPQRSESAQASPLETTWIEEVARATRELREKEIAGIALDAAELAEAITAALSFVPSLELETKTERDRITTFVRGHGHSVGLTYLTQLHHGSIAASLSRAIESAEGCKWIVLREARLPLPSTWAQVHERKEAFERLPNARWLSVDLQDAAQALALARILSATRASRISANANVPLTVEHARFELGRLAKPCDWGFSGAIVRALSDVPRDLRGFIRAGAARYAAQP